MATEKKVDLKSLSDTLASAKVHLDDALMMSGAEILPAVGSRALKAVGDTNSSCNTGCSCGSGSAELPTLASK